VAAAGPALIVTALNNDDGINDRLHLIGAAGNRPVARAPQLTGLLRILDEAGCSKPGRTGPDRTPTVPAASGRQTSQPASARTFAAPARGGHPITMATTVRLVMLLPHR
jgi:hypothetical protein